MLKDVLFWIYVVEGRDGMNSRMTSSSSFKNAVK